MKPINVVNLRSDILHSYCNSTGGDVLLKILVIGDPAVGKTSFVERYVKNVYNRNYSATIGVDFAFKIVKMSETQSIKVQMWDIAGQERFTWMTRVYYQNANGCVIMFDLSNKKSFENAAKWKKDLDAKCQLENGDPIPCYLLANKCDLTKRQVDTTELEIFRKEHNFSGWSEVSAKDDIMVADSMKQLLAMAMNQKPEDFLEGGIKLDTKPSNRKFFKKCACK